MKSFEHQLIDFENLPVSWKDESALDELETFLNSCWKQRSVFYNDNEDSSTQQFVRFENKNSIKTRNYIGSIFFKGEKLTIFPKIFSKKSNIGCKEDCDKNIKIDDNFLVKNLVFWLSYNDKINFPFLSVCNDLKNSEDLLELFISIYARLVCQAIDRQLFFQYENITEEGNFIKGKIDFRDYSVDKYAKGLHHRLRYTFSNYVFDNEVNRIIKFTCSLLESKVQNSSTKLILRKILMRLNDVSLVNSYSYQCDRIHLGPLHKNYQYIISLSKMFLLNSLGTNNIGKDHNFCFLFPAELLFEGFVYGYLKLQLESKDPSIQVSRQTSDNYLASLFVDDQLERENVFNLREDILVKRENKILVLDIKYKVINSFDSYKFDSKLGISDSDVKQLVIYGIKRNSNKLFLMYPYQLEENTESKTVKYQIKIGDSKSQKMELSILKVPFVYDDEYNMDDVVKKILEF